MKEMSKEDCEIPQNISMALCKQQDNTTKPVGIFKQIGFFRCNVNPCFYMKQSMKGSIYQALYEDVMWNHKAIDCHGKGW